MTSSELNMSLNAAIKTTALSAAVVLTIEVIAPPIAVDDVAAGDVFSSTVLVTKQFSEQETTHSVSDCHP